MRGLASYVVVCVVSLTTADNPTQQEEDMNYYLGQLYETVSDQLDPNDMLAYPGRKREPSEDSSGGWFGSLGSTSGQNKYQEEDGSGKESGTVNSEQQMDIQIKLSDCKAQVANLETNIESEQQKSSLLQKKLANEGSIDMKAFYMRLIHHLWNVLELEEAWGILKDNSAKFLRRHLTVDVTRQDLDTLQGFLHNQQHIHEVDEFMEQAFTLEKAPDEHGGSILQGLLALLLSVFEVGKNIEVWLYFLCLGFLMLAAWAVCLFVRDIHRELRWGRVMMMMMVIVFFICCLWHWRHMHKLAEAKRHAQMVKQGYKDLPEECKPGAQGAGGSVFEWIKVNLFRSPDVCERYFEQLMIDPTEEITPAMVISETLAKFFLQPLQHVGSEMAKLITNFYSTVPLVYHIPATVVFLVMLVVILFYAFGYGIDFPLWMGGIRPIYRTEAPDTGEVDRITREAIAQLNQDRARFLEESRHILTDITRAATMVQGQENFQPLMQMSSGILENQLERLISRQIGIAINQRQSTEPQRHYLETALAPDTHGLDTSVALDISGRHQAIFGVPTIHTVTSTPLHSNSDKGVLTAREGQGSERSEMGSDSEVRGRGRDVVAVEPRRGIRRGVSSGVCETNTQEGNSEARQGTMMEVDSGSTHSRREAYARSSSCGRIGLPASTDGVHHRIQGLPKKNILPPKKSNRGSTSSLEEGKGEVLNEKPQKKQRLEKCKKGHSDGWSDDWEGWRARLGRLGRKFHSTNSVDREASPSPCSTNTNTSTHSLYQDLPPMSLAESDHEVFNESGAIGISRSSILDTSERDVLDSLNGTGASEDFFVQVKSLLEDSVNSSQNESQLEGMSSSPGTIRRRKRVKQEEQAEEVELSSPGAMFLKSVEKELNP